MIACFAWTNSQIINITNAKINLYPNEKADIYIRMGTHMSKSLISAVKTSQVFEHVYYLDPINLDYKKLKCGFSKYLRLFFLRKGYEEAYNALLEHLCGERKYNRAMLAWFFTENVFLLNYWSKFTDQLAITFVDEGTGSYCYTKKEICFPMFMANSAKIKIKRYLAEGKLARRFAKNIDTICLYRPEYCRPDIDFEKKQLPIISKETNPIMYELLCNAVQSLDYIHQIQYEKRDYYYFTTYSAEGKSFDLRSLEILDTIVRSTSEKKSIVKVHMGNTQHGTSFAQSYEEKLFVDRERYIYEGLYAQLGNPNKKVLISCASTATINPKFMFGDEPYVIFTYRLYDTYRQCGVERDDWISSALIDAYEDKSRVKIPNSMFELEEMLKEIYRNQ